MEKIYIEDCCEILDSMRIPITASDRKEGPYPYYGANGIQDYVADYIFDDELVLLAEDGGNFGSKERPIAYRVSGKCWVNNHAHVLKPKEGLNVDYLCYSLMFYNVAGMVNGATRQKLTQAAMRKMMIPKRTLDEQINIVDKLNRVVEIKKKRQKELEELDNLIKSQFVNPYPHYFFTRCGQLFFFVDNHLLYSDKFALSVVNLRQIELATEEDKTYHIDYWARIFKAKTWEDIKMLAKENEYLQEAANSLYVANADEIVRQQCRAREDAERRERTLERDKRLLEEKNVKLANQIDELTQQNNEKDARIAELEALLAKQK